jgi:endonuclease/exonuclease/phosphatase (EEP) superfamily protein YafD
VSAPLASPKSTLTFTGLLEVVSACLLLATIAASLGRLWWMFELATHFRVHLACALTVFCVCWMFRRRWRAAGLCGVCAALNSVPVLLLLRPGSAPHAVNPGAGRPLRLVAINVHTSNQHHDRVLDFLQRSDADVILLMEVDSRWLFAMQPMQSLYPHRIVEVREDNFGIAMFSRLPWTNAQIIELGAEVPSIEAMLEFDGGLVKVLGTHPLPPGSADYARLRNAQLERIAVWGRRQTRPAIVMGDLNVTPWSPVFSDLLREGGLRNTSQGLGFFASWPAGLPVGRIPIDHCLVTPDWQVDSKRLGPDIGSDHLPVMVDLRLIQTAWPNSPSNTVLPGRYQPQRDQGTAKVAGNLCGSSLF